MRPDHDHHQRHHSSHPDFRLGIRFEYVGCFRRFSLTNSFTLYNFWIILWSMRDSTALHVKLASNLGSVLPWR